ncbi:MAG: hypothetical protein F6K54_40660 [Okeania sp. SIO3B5]|nr:hypothetical protein [Okeania sp. SIO3B5]NEO58796.1 hypothetical protein [Okeania sp. SIO3B5]
MTPYKYDMIYRKIGFKASPISGRLSILCYNEIGSIPTLSHKYCRKED